MHILYFHHWQVLFAMSVGRPPMTGPRSLEEPTSPRVSQSLCYAQPTKFSALCDMHSTGMTFVGRARKKCSRSSSFLVAAFRIHPSRKCISVIVRSYANAVRRHCVSFRCNAPGLCIFNYEMHLSWGNQWRKHNDHHFQIKTLVRLHVFRYLLGHCGTSTCIDGASVIG